MIIVSSAAVLSAMTMAAIVALAVVRRPVALRRSTLADEPRRWWEAWPTPFTSRRTSGGDGRRDTALPDALDAMCRSLRAGQSVSSALAAAADESYGPIAAQWNELVASVSRGTDLGDAVRSWGAAGSRRSGERSGPDEALAAAAISIGVEFGGPRADAIEAVAQTLRERASLSAQLRGFAAQARLSAAIISLAPLAFTSVSVAGDHATRHVLLGSAPGRVCVVSGVSLDAIGWWWMGRITTRAAGPTS